MAVSASLRQGRIVPLPLHRPLVHGHRADRAVEAQRRLVPVEHPPFEPRQPLGDAAPGEMPQSALPMPRRGRPAARTDPRDRSRAGRGRSRNCRTRARSRPARRSIRRSRRRRAAAPEQRLPRDPPRVASTSWASRSYSASSRMKARTTGAIPAAAPGGYVRRLRGAHARTIGSPLRSRSAGLARPPLRPAAASPIREHRVDVVEDEEAGAVDVVALLEEAVVSVKR